MKILIAPDKFKYTLSSRKVAEAINIGIKNVYPEIETIILPLADGGEGTAEIFAGNNSAEKIYIEVYNSVNKKITAVYFYSSKKNRIYRPFVCLRIRNIAR
jgi:glycerate kinase